MKKKIDKSGEYRGIKYESNEELYILYYLFELKDAGIIVSIERAESFNLGQKITTDYKKVKTLKTKIVTKEKEFLILRKHIYTPDYKCIWSEIYQEKFVSHFSTSIIQRNKPDTYFLYNTSENFLPITYLEIKPDFNLVNNMERIFKVNQKWVYDKYTEYINLVKPKELFEVTFTPQEYLKTKTGKDKKINFPIKTLQEYLNESINNS